MAIKAPKLTDRQFKFFPKLPPEIRLMVWRHALPKPRTITITSTDFTTRGERGWPVRNNRVSHNAQNVPCILHACPESRRLALKTYQLAFGRQLRQQPIYFNFQTDILLLADESAVKSFFGGINEFEAFGVIGDLKKKVRHLAIGGYLGCGKIWDQLGELESLQILILQRLKPGYGFSHVMMENLESLEVKWQIRIESNHIESQEQSVANGVRASRGLMSGIPEIQWLTEAKLRQKSNRERELRPKGAKKIISPPAPYRRPKLRSEFCGFFHEE
ncbi:hypothetical protein L207DRAFT_580838 [Hyaloscypha variabilis F]|uniref:2EXR domain-containing protein n=1 Tax=Hyaloscypha variabilis (strain UAMH 11265 / GT02V1 / F) TaxID=1149755 RepID=A0A2J6RUG7_HYAVF|nr:hypothetical protein L207DRAFT_580838 [Hyaloscypha variabilis F]